MSHGGIKYQTRQSGKEKDRRSWELHHQKEKTDVVGSCGQNEQEQRSQTSDELEKEEDRGKIGRRSSAKTCENWN